jgi:hypothetical protein
MISMTRPACLLAAALMALPDGARATGPQGGAAELASLECRAARCAVEVALPAELAPEAQVAELQAIAAWLALSQPCSYTLIPGAPGSGEPVRAFTDCEER